MATRPKKWKPTILLIIDDFAKNVNGLGGIVMGYNCSTDILSSFKNDILSFGLIPPGNIENGKIFRCKAIDKKNGRPGWGVLYVNPDGSAGACIGNYATGVKQNFFYNGLGERHNDLSRDELRAFNQMIEEKTREERDAQEQRQKVAADMSKRFWDGADPASDGHPYLQAKGIKAYNIRQIEDKLIVPYLDEDMSLMSIQWIHPDGSKKNQPNGKISGGFFIFGEAGGSNTIYICEGYATGATIHEATEQAVVVAFSAHNLEPVTGTIAKMYPNKKIVIAADNDLGTAEKNPTLGNPGVKAAETAALKYGVEVSICPAATDFNDLHQSEGLEAVRNALDKTQTITLSEQEKPQPLPDELKPVERFDYKLLPERLRPWIEDISLRMQCPPDFVAITAITLMGSIIGRKVGIRPQNKTPWTVIPNLWAMIVGRPGLLKSPAQEAALAPVKRLIATAGERYNELEQEYKTAMAEHKLRSEAQEKQARKELQSNPEASIKELLALYEEPKAPVLKRYIANDTTPASLGELLRQNPNGLLVFRDELVSLLKNLDKDGNDEGRGFYLTAWNGDSPYTFDRIGRGLNLSIPALCLSLVGGTQPGRLSEYIHTAVKGGAADDGLIQRFGLLVWPDQSNEWKNVDEYPNKEAKNTAFQVFDELDRLDPMAIGASQDTDFDGQPEGVPYLRFNPGALELFTEWRAALETKLRLDTIHPALESHFAKYRKLIPSLALIIHLADGGAGDIAENATLKALAWSEYLESHAERAYASVSQPEVSTAKAILRKIKSGDLKTPFASKDVWRPNWSKLSDRETVEAGLAMLVDYNHLCVETRATGGRPATLYYLNGGHNG